MKKKDWKLVGSIAIIVLAIIVMIVYLVLKIWVYYEYGDTPIADVPAWAIPWLTNGR